MSYQDDIKYEWQELRPQVSATTDPLAISSFSYTDWPTSETFDFKAKFPFARAAKIMFFGSNAANEDSFYTLHGRHRMNGPIEPLLAGAVVLGAKVCAIHPITKVALTNHFWADQISVATGLMDEVDTIQNDGANDEIAAITFPVQGIVDLFLEIDTPGGSVTAASMGAIITGIYE